MPIVYKLTNQDNRTHGGMQWGTGVTNAVEWGGKMCAHGCLHAYRSAALAVLMNPIHANIQNPVLWRGRTPKILADDGTKIGMERLTTLEIVPLPMPTTEQRIWFAIRVSLLQYGDVAFVAWAKSWLSGEDRSAYAARAAYTAVYAARAAYTAVYAARAAADAAAYAAAYAADAAAYAADAADAAAYAAVYAAYAAYAADAADAAAYAAVYAAYAADAAVYAAYAADADKTKIYRAINRIAKQVLQCEP